MIGEVLLLESVILPLSLGTSTAASRAMGGDLLEKMCNEMSILECPANAVSAVSLQDVTKVFRTPYATVQAEDGGLGGWAVGQPETAAVRVKKRNLSVVLSGQTTTPTATCPPTAGLVLRRRAAGSGQ